jgi:hypothetical protein
VAEKFSVRVDPFLVVDVEEPAERASENTL